MPASCLTPSAGLLVKLATIAQLVDETGVVRCQRDHAATARPLRIATHTPNPASTAPRTQ